MATRRPGYWWGEENDWRGRGNPEAVNRVDLRSERRARQAPLYTEDEDDDGWRYLLLIYNVMRARSFLPVCMSHLQLSTIIVVVVLVVIIIRQRAGQRARRRVDVFTLPSQCPSHSIFFLLCDIVTI